ncbi:MULTISPECIES: hypothetical protein [unclassified Kitasatospora]|uniref:hypothetical protein n=1 Tax=unclassified Kitasatospora TaxID=2633591 RepID=UPI00070D66CF|nr:MULTISPECIES: hypothetical protein [unclassified Kitasatospora]KQV05612.1 hypothetical protein ASC99_12465 [Kitasatospora sp. Root107]KRB62415.1 hypothetical protein ASE03_07415 [Kitasatospora sp. Root187]
MPQNTSFDEHTIAYTDDAYDRERASNGHSRYGAYLADRADQFGGPRNPLTPVEFATAAWHIATSPVMSPGYVLIRPDLATLTADVDEEGNLHLRAELPITHRALAVRPAVRMDDWSTYRDTWNPSPWHPRIQPETVTRPTLLTTAVFLIPVPLHLLTAPAGGYHATRTVQEAKRTVQALAQHANQHAHLIGALR